MANKVLIWSGVGLMLVGSVAWLGTAYIGSNAAEEQLQQFQTLKAVGSTPINVTKLEHHKGFLNSNGVVEFTLPSVALKEQDPAKMTVVYEISHLPLPTGANRGQFTMTLGGLGIEEALGAPLEVKGKGSLGLSGNVDVTLESQEVNMDRDGTQVSVAPLRINVQCSQSDCQQQRNIRYRASLPAASAKDGDISLFDVQALTIEGLLLDGMLQTGTMSADVDSAKMRGSAGEEISLVKFHLETDTAEVENKLNAAAKISLAAMKSDEYNLQNLVMNYHINGLLTAPLRQMVEVSNTSDGFSALTEEQAQRLNDSVMTLLRGGFSFGVDTLSGNIVDEAEQTMNWIGSMSANLTAAEQDGAIRLESQLVSNGSVKVTGGTATTLAQISPLLKAIPDGFEASYALKDGELMVSDQPFPAPLVQGMIVGLNREINNFAAKGMTAAEWQSILGGKEVMSAPVKNVPHDGEVDEKG